MATLSAYPLPTKEGLVKAFVGKSIKDVYTPAVVLDLNIIKKNCSRLLEAIDALDFGFRAHIKTHKTTELTRLQVGNGTGPANIIVSTILEAERILPLLLEYKSKGRLANVLYGLPISPGSVPRLAAVAQALGNHGLSLMIDHQAQLDSVTAVHKASGVVLDIFLKIDMGYGRAGVPPQTEAAQTLITATLDLSKSGACHFLGLYCHAGQSYSGSSRVTALNYLNTEFQTLLTTSKLVQPFLNYPLVLSVGATPTTTSIRNLLVEDSNLHSEETSAITAIKSTISSIRETGCKLEMHAGVYPVLDVQQLSTHALPSSGAQAVTFDDIAITVVAEVASLYPGRGAGGTIEALIGAGTLALGREPCKAYSGWGILTPWNRPGASIPVTADEYTGWIVGRISQEHGILTYQSTSSQAGEARTTESLEIGQKVRVWPNHACVAGSGFGWYLIVDGTDEIVDCWVRWSGW